MKNYTVEELNLIVDKIYQALNKKREENTDLGILAGTSGIALFYFKYAEYIESSESFDYGLELIEKSIDSINQGYNMPTYCSGIAGYGWLMNYLKIQQYIDVDTHDLFDQTDELLYEVMLTASKNYNYDFLHGALGYAFHFLQQFENNTSSVAKAKYEKYILDFVFSLKAFAIQSADGYKWSSYTNLEQEELEYNISLSHGISSIINFLSRLYPYACFKNEVEDMLHQAVKYVTSFKGKEINSISLFPNRISHTGEISWNSRLAWCYGDLGVAVSLWNYAQAINDEALKKEVIAIVKEAAKRRKGEETLVFDAGVCHGSFGNAQLFNHFYNETNCPEFLDAAVFWINEGMSRMTDNEEYAGFMRWEHPNQWVGDLTLLGGISGIGLSILSHLTRDNSWDKCLLISR